MGEVERYNLKNWCLKVGNDPDLLGEDAYGKKVPMDAGPSARRVKTYCNVLVQRICGGMGYGGLDGKTANQIYDHLKANWFEVDGEQARDSACLGDLALAAWKNPNPVAHGHVAVVFPDKQMVFSGHWNRYCPKVCAVDKPVPIGANYSFHEMPTYFKLGRVTQ